jgi:hypothetical protein
MDADDGFFYWKIDVTLCFKSRRPLAFDRRHFRKMYASQDGIRFAYRRNARSVTSSYFGKRILQKRRDVLSIRYAAGRRRTRWNFSHGDRADSRPRGRR